MKNKLFCLVSGITVLLVLVTALSACAPKPEPEYAGKITEDILLAINEGNYGKYSEHFDEAMKEALPEDVFEQIRAQIKSGIGDYISREFWKTTEQGSYTAVYYRAKFTGETELATVKIVFQEIDGRVYVSGLWLDSPGLRK